MPIDSTAALAALQTWVPGRRWYPLKGTDVTLTIEAAIPVADDVSVLLVGAGALTLQVPVALRDAPGVAPIAETEAGWLVDATQDLDAVHAMLGGGDGITVEGAVPHARSVRIISGEQSNTSIIGDADAPWIAKVFRVVDDGDQPDVVVTSALTRAGVRRVPALVAATTATWRQGSRTRSAGLVAVSEFVAGGEDAWALVKADAAAALAGAQRADLDVADLGRAVAEVHVALADVFGTADADEAARTAFVDGLRSRAAWALAQSQGALTHLDSAVAAWSDGLGTLPVARLQRIHGDLHLGQVLRQPGRGFVLLDFEGEPLRPLAERSLPEPTERDVAGMLRSFDYAAASAALEVDAAPGAGDAWRDRAQAAFLTGYRDVREPGEAELIRALTIDKALYEVVLEVRYRPDWVRIPVGALEVLLAP